MKAMTESMKSAQSKCLTPTQACWVSNHRPKTTRSTTTLTLKSSRQSPCALTIFES